MENGEFEKKDPLWIEFNLLENTLKEKKEPINKIVYNIIVLANKFLKNYSKREELEEIIIAFESIINTLVYYYGDDAKALYENDKEGEILSSFDSLIFNYDYKTELNKLKENINEYIDSHNKNDIS